MAANITKPIKNPDEIKLNEFNERYVIINQEGKIYTIKERENNE